MSRPPVKASACSSPRLTLLNNKSAKVTTKENASRERRPNTSYTATNLSTPSPGGKFLTCTVHGRCEGSPRVQTRLTHESWWPYRFLVWLLANTALHSRHEDRSKQSSSTINLSGYNVQANKRKSIEMHTCTHIHTRAICTRQRPVRGNSSQRSTPRPRLWWHAGLVALRLLDRM